jgi:thioredoxin-like negative regulator of GroEL
VTPAQTLRTLLERARELHDSAELMHSVVQDSHDPVEGPSLVHAISLASAIEGAASSLVLHLEEKLDAERGWTRGSRGAA